MTNNHNDKFPIKTATACQSNGHGALFG
jgi:hypothetical protein